MGHGIVDRPLKVALVFTIVATPPEWKIQVMYTRDGKNWVPFEALPYAAQLYAGQAIRAWADAHLK